MAGGFFDSLGQGMQLAGGILSPDVYNTLHKTQMQRMQNSQSEKLLAIKALYEGIQNGSIDPAVGGPVLQKLGIPVPVGRTADTQAKLAELRDAQEYSDLMKQIQQEQPPKAAPDAAAKITEMREMAPMPQVTGPAIPSNTPMVSGPNPPSNMPLIGSDGADPIQAPIPVANQADLPNVKFNLTAETIGELIRSPEMRKMLEPHIGKPRIDAMIADYQRNGTAIPSPTPSAQAVQPPAPSTQPSGREQSRWYGPDGKETSTPPTVGVQKPNIHPALKALADRGNARAREDIKSKLELYQKEVTANKPVEHYQESTGELVMTYPNGYTQVRKVGSDKVLTGEITIMRNGKPYLQKAYSVDLGKTWIPAKGSDAGPKWESQIKPTGGAAGTEYGESANIALKDGTTVLAMRIKGTPDWVYAGTTVKIPADQMSYKGKSTEGGAEEFTEGAITLMAQEFNSTGRLPPLGRGGDQGLKIRGRVLSRAAEMLMEAGQAGEKFSNVPSIRAEYKANVAALTALTKDVASIQPYKEMLDRNAQIAIDLGKKIILSDSKLANKTLNWLRQNLTNDEDVSEYLFQINTLQAEAARVLNNPRLVGQMSYEATKDMKEVISGEMPLASAIRVIQRMQKDGTNRVMAMQSKQLDLVNMLRSKVKKQTGGAPADTGNKGYKFLGFENN